MEKMQDIDLDELEKYVRDRREAEERAKLDAIRAQQQKLIDEKEAAREETRRREAEERIAGDPNHRAAVMVFSALGDQWPLFLKLMSSGTMAKMGAALNRIAGEHAAGAKHRDLNSAPAVRQERDQAVAAVRHAGIEAQLASAGVNLGFTAD